MPPNGFNNNEPATVAFPTCICPFNAAKCDILIYSVPSPTLDWLYKLIPLICGFAPAFCKTNSEGGTLPDAVLINVVVPSFTIVLFPIVLALVNLTT